MKTIAKCKQEKMYSGVFRDTFFAFRSISHQGSHSCEKSKNVVVYFFAAVIKNEMCMKYEKCIVSVSYFAVCLVKTLAKYLLIAKYKKYAAGNIHIGRVSLENIGVIW